MRDTIYGFQVEVTLNDEIPHVRVKHRNGDLVLETSALSILGMRRMGAVFESAAEMAFDELDFYWLKRHTELRRERSGGMGSKS